jgi:serine/threonine protein kinase
MEKVPGDNLEQWLDQNGVLSEAMAIDWLSQLSQFLTQLHQEQILHRNIKPSNIILRPDGKLILIDFGTARRITSTYIEKLPAADVTRVYTSGYTAPEQLKGQAVCKSDFFALGCTLVHLLTGIHPDNLAKNESGHLMWRNRVPHISQELANLIDRLIAPLVSERLQTPQLFLNHLLERELATKDRQAPFNKTRTVKRKMSRVWHDLWKFVAVFSAIAVTIIVLHLI